MNTLPMNVLRDREKPLQVGQVDIRGATILFSMSDRKGLEFTTLPGTALTVSGLNMSVYGKLKFQMHTFDVESIEIEDASSTEPGAYRREDWLQDYFKRMDKSIITLVGQAFQSMVSATPEALPDAFQEKLDDLALDQIESIGECFSRFSTAVSFDDRRIWEDMIFDKQRQLQSIDEAGSGHAYPFATMSGYLVTIDNKPVSAPANWGRNPEGWVGRLLHRRHDNAKLMVSEIGNPDAVVERMRIIDGDIYLVRKEGFVKLDWSMDDMVRTFRAESQAAS